MSQNPHPENKRRVLDAMRAIAESTPAGLGRCLDSIYHPQAHWRGSHPLNEMDGPAAIASRVWGPLLGALDGAERRDDLLLAGHYDGQDHVAAVGHIAGNFRRPWLGIAPTGGMVYLRYGEVHQIVDGRIICSTVLFDLLDFLRQAGFDALPPSLGREGRWPAPMTADGVRLEPSDPVASAASLALTLQMQASLGAHDDGAGTGRDGLLHMPQKAFWHPRMNWYGPSGIGTAHGLDGFVDCHQLPFRTAFPNLLARPRTETRQRDGKNHYVRIGDGAYSATGGWPSRFLHHEGAGWLGLPGTGRAVTMRVMDFYRAEDGLIRENWVPIDLIEVLLQLGVDVMARAQRHFAARGLDLARGPG